MTTDQLKAHFPNASKALLDANAEATPAAPVLDCDVEPPDGWAGPEKELHRLFSEWCRLHSVHAIHARTDMESTIAAGHPDFTCLYVPCRDTGIARACCVEFKRAGESLKPKQREYITAMRALGIPVCVAWNLETAIHFCVKHLGC